MRQRWIAMAAVLVLTAGLGLAQKKDEASATRSVQGVVTTADDSAVDGAVVQLKNTKTLQIRSFFTKDGGNYYFQGLSPDIDYEIRADHDGASSPSKTLSSFDSRKKAVVNLKLNKK
jgi:Carboxypeptidase regulatory-like domain